MQRREFLRPVSAAPAALDARAAAAPPAATVLYDDKAVTLHAIGRDPKRAKEALSGSESRTRRRPEKSR